MSKMGILKLVNGLWREWRELKLRGNTFFFFLHRPSSCLCYRRLQIFSCLETPQCSQSLQNVLDVYTSKYMCVCKRVAVQCVNILNYYNRRIVAPPAEERQQCGVSDPWWGAQKLGM